MPIVADDKNWTWVLERECPQCGFAAADIDCVDVAGMVRANAAAWVELLEHPAVRRRPSDDQWSALEYGCHVRDVLRLYDFRLDLMLTHDDPPFPNWDQDATAVEQRYDLADPTVVTAELVEAGERLAARFEGLNDGDWSRTGRRSDGVAFTVDTFARYMIHDPIHHVWDVDQGFAKLVAG